MKIDDQIKFLGDNYILFQDKKIHITNKCAAKEILKEIFLDRCYFFKCHKSNPKIIDCGSNIGISILFFKYLYPDSEIISFEPDPKAFSALKKNILENKLTNVVCVNSAVSDKKGEIPFYGQIFEESPDSRGNSVIPFWGIQREKNSSILVESEKLSDYISNEVDFLKLDIEGAEESVISDLNLSNKLKYVKELVIEVHELECMSDLNSAERIVSILERNKFKVDILRKNTSLLLPDEVKEWQEKMKPRLLNIHAFRCGGGS